jgi:hypothetical protein
MAAPENKVANATAPGVWVSKKTVNKKNDHYYNRGLMSLLDILYTPELYMMNPSAAGPAVAFPNWKRGNYIKSKSKKRQAGYKEFFDILNNVCRLMENFLLYQLKDSIIWEKDKTWPMREWMVNIAHTLNISPGRLQPTTRATMLMTPDHSVESPNSLSARLRSSLRITLPQLDESVMQYLKLNGFDNIRDSELYLRLVGVTNYLALQELARTHETLLGSSELHARVFNGLSLGTQSEMKLMFQRITMRPDTVHDAMSRLDIKSPLPAPKRHSNIMTHAVGKDLIRRLVDATIIKKHRDLNVWKDDDTHIPALAIIQYIITNATYFMTTGIYQLARSWPCTLEMPAVPDTGHEEAKKLQDAIVAIIELAKNANNNQTETDKFINIDGKVNTNACIYMKDPEENDMLDRFDATFDEFVDEEVDDVSRMNVTDEDKTYNLQCKKLWCGEFLLGFIRLHQFIHALINTEKAFEHRENLMLYLQDFESLTDLQTIEFLDLDKIKTSTQENMKTQDLLKFTGKMLLFTWASVLTHVDGDSNYDKNMAEELMLIAENNSNLMTEWLNSVAVIMDSRKQVKDSIELMESVVDKSSTRYKTKREFMIATRKINEEKENQYKTQNAFILYEQYFNFRKKKFLYGQEIERLPLISHDDNTLYDDSDVSTESSSDEDL